MNTLKQQIIDTRNYLYQNRMYSELEGFDTAIRMFADANKKSFKDKAAEVWKKHKGKILAGAALAAAAGTGGYLGYKKYKEAHIPEDVAIKVATMGEDALVDVIVRAMEGKNESWYKSIPSSVMLSYYKKKAPALYERAEAKYKEKHPSIASIVASGSNGLGKPATTLPAPKAS